MWLIEVVPREAKEKAEAKERYMKVSYECSTGILVVERFSCSSTFRVRQSKRRWTSLVCQGSKRSERLLRRDAGPKLRVSCCLFVVFPVLPPAPAKAAEVEAKKAIGRR